MVKVRHDRNAPLAAPKDGKVFEGRVARTHAPGDALHYDTGEEYRDLAEVRRIVDALPGIKITLTHPDGLLGQGVEAKVVGKVLAGRLDGDHAVAEFVIFDPETLAAIQSGVRELSLGYQCVLDATRYQRDIKLDHLAVVAAARCGASCEIRADGSGCTCANTDTLTAAQRRMIPAGRFAVPDRGVLPLEDAGHVRDAMARFGETHFMGPAEKKGAFHRVLARAHELGIDPSNFEKKWGHRLDGDCASAISVPTSASDVPARESEVTTEQLEAALAAEKTRADQAAADLETAKTSLAAANAALETARAAAATAEAATEQVKKDAAAAETARLAATETARKDAETAAAAETARKDAEAAALKVRVDAMTSANAILGSVDKDGNAIDRSAMSVRDIKCAIVKHVDGDDIAADKHEAYVDAMFDGAVKRHRTGADALAGARAAIVTPPHIDAVPVVDAEAAANQVLRDRMSGAWMPKTPKKDQ